MKTYTAFSKDYEWIELGSYSECCALAENFCRQDPSRVAYVGQMRGGELRGRLIYEFTSGSITRISPPKFFEARDIKRAHSALRSNRYE